MARAFTASGQGSWGRLMSNPTAEPHSQQLGSLIFLACYSFFLLPLSNSTCHSRKRAICGPFCRNLEWGRHTWSLVSTTYFDTPRLRPFLYSTPPLTRLEEVGAGVHRFKSKPRQSQQSTFPAERDDVDRKSGLEGCVVCVYVCLSVRVCMCEMTRSGPRPQPA